jgi:hypothetical protein
MQFFIFEMIVPRAYSSITRDIKILISLAVYKFPSGSSNYSYFSTEIPCEM